MALRMSTLFLRTLREDPADAEVPEPPAARAGRLHPPRRPRHLHLAAAGPEGAAQRRAHRARGDGRHRRPGAALPGAAAPRALRGHRPLDRVRRQHLPAQGPQGRRLPARADPRGDVHPRGQGPVLVVQGPAAVDLPDPDQVPRRGTSARRPAARARVRHEGLLLLRRRRRRARGVLPAHRDAYIRIFDRLGFDYVIVAAMSGAMGGSQLRGVPRDGRERRGHLRALHATATTPPTSRPCGCRSRTPCRTTPTPRRARRGHPGHPHHRDAGRPPQRGVPARRTVPGRPATR